MEHKCEICENTFGTKRKLKYHFVAVHDQKNYNCVSCGKSFTTEQNLKRHIHTVHEGHKDYKLSLIHI